MSTWTRIKNVFRSDRLRGELDEEMQAHIDEAIENGRDPEEARRAFGSLLRRREDSQDIKLSTWLESLRNDAVFGARQLMKHKTVSVAAILSLALAIGACTAAFRLIDAMLLRPLPVADADRLYFLEYQFQDAKGKAEFGDSFEYPMFRELRAALKDQAEFLAISYTSRIDLTYGSDQEMEKAYRQYVSGWTFGTFGLKPALGRLLTSSDDVKPGAHPYMVLSYDYWTRRFGQDPKVLGRKCKMGTTLYEIVGVAGEGFTGTETGTITDFFVPTMMNARAIENPNWGWFRTWVRLNPGAPAGQVQERIQATFKAWRAEKAKNFPPSVPMKQREMYVNAPVRLEQAFAGASGMQKQYRRPLAVLGAVVLLVLLIACANVANLMTAQATTRAKEMALRVSIGAGRLRLLQLVFVESGLISILASIAGGIFAMWAAPFVVTMINPPDSPARLVLPADWRVMGFATLLASLVTLLFGLGPAIRASAVNPMAVIRGGSNPHSRRRIMQTLTAVQMAFCVLVLFITGLFLTTFQRLAAQPVGFTPSGLLTLDTNSLADQPIEVWFQVADHLRSLTGVQSSGLSSWALMSGNGWSSEVSIGGQVRSDGSSPYFLNVSPKWMETMRIPMIDGRDFRPDESAKESAIVNEAFAKRFFDGRSPVGRSFETMDGKVWSPIRIVGYVRDARYRDVREEIRPTIYVPFPDTDSKGQPRKRDWATFVVRTTSEDPLQMASMLRQEVSRARPELRVSDIQTQTELVRSHMVRERLLAVLSVFFGVVALVLAGVGLFGVIQYAMLQRRREIGIRMALGAKAGDVARRVTGESFLMLGLGAIAGVGAGLASLSLVESLLFGVKGNDPSMIAIPACILIATALLAAVAPVIQAIRIDPASMLRSE